jgi:putative intracellular protease/amidase
MRQGHAVVGILIFDDVEVLISPAVRSVFTDAAGGAATRRTDDSAPLRPSLSPRARRGDGDWRVEGDAALRLVPCAAIDILVIPGGFWTRALLNDQATLDWIREAARRRW